MTTVYLTGDRSFEPIAAVSVVAAVMNTLIQQSGGQLKIVTGNSPTGIERAIRYLVPEQFLTIHDYVENAEGRVDFLESMKTIKQDADAACVIHMEPLNSRLAQAVSMSFDPSVVTFPLDLLVNKAPEDLSAFDAELLEPLADEDVPPEVQ